LERKTIVEERLEAWEDWAMACVRLPYWTGPGREPLWRQIATWLQFFLVAGGWLGVLFGLILLFNHGWISGWETWGIGALCLGVFCRFVMALDRASAADMRDNVFRTRELSRLGWGPRRRPERGRRPTIAASTSRKAGVRVALRTGPAQCAYCHADQEAPSYSCPGCATLLHPECLREGGGCTSLGCAYKTPRSRG
jgi:hypothetical protein